MKTRLLVSAVTVAALSLGSVSSFAQGWRNDGGRYDHRGDGRAYIQQAPRGAWQGRESREHEWREHERREHGWRGYGYAPPVTVYQPGYAYAAPVYQDPGYAYQPPVYYGGQYVDGSDAAFGAIVGGIIGAAIAANH